MSASVVTEVLVAGGGPAGMAVAIFAHQYGLKTVLMEGSANLGGQLLWAANEIQNYPGFVGLTGPQLAEKFVGHLKALAVPCFLNERLVRIDAPQFLAYSSLRSYQYRYLILALGLQVRRLLSADHAKLAGISYSATADGAQFAGLPVVMVGGGDNALEEALMLAEICPRVHVVHRRKEFKARQSFVKKALQHPRIHCHLASELQAIHGQEAVSSVTVREKDRLVIIECAAVFVRIGFEPCVGEVTGPPQLKPDGRVEVGEGFATSLAGVFAIGDALLPKNLSVAHAVGDAGDVIKHILDLEEHKRHDS